MDAQRVSIHTPTKGVTLETAMSSSYKSCFNPHTHEGCDMILYYDPTTNSVVSIHTPTKGVTVLVALAAYLSDCFNPHTHEGCDTSTSTTLPLSLSFNPHTHEGCDKSAPLP